MAAFFLTAGTGSLFAQTELSQPAPAEQAAAVPSRINKITIKFVGMANVSEQIVRANMVLREETDLDEALIDRDIRSLYRTGIFEFIEVKREQLSGNLVNLVVEVTPKFRVLTVNYEGNKTVKSRRLSKEIKTVANGPLDERLIKEDAQKIYEFYQKRGFNQAQATYTIDRNRTTGFSTVTFKVREGARVKIAAVNFVGNDHVKARRLKKEMETKKWHMFSWLMGNGRLKDDEFDEDLKKLRDYYQEQGYLDVEIAEDKVTFDYPKSDKLVITIRVVEGRQYRIGDISFSGNKIFPETLLRLLPRQHKGQVFTPSKLDKDTESIEDFYSRGGYLQTRVRLVRKPNLQTGNIDVEYQINESEQFQVESIKIEGNDKTKSIVILRELVLGPGDIFDGVRMKISKLRLENTRFFEDPVNVTDESTNIPGRRTLKISVKEARTGNLTFGAGFSSLEKAVVFAEVTQSNFDLFNRRSFFQGDGQKFRLKFQVGSQSSELVLAFEEPYLFERELALGFQIYRTTSEYNSSYYEEIRTGGEVYLRKRLFNWLESRLSYTYEVIDIANVNTNAPNEIRFLEGKTTTSRLGLNLTQDTRDKIINTTRGHYVNLGLELAGGPLGGDNHYYKIEFRGSKFFPVAEFQEQVLAVIGRAGVVDSFGDSDKKIDRVFSTGITDPTTGLIGTVTIPIAPGVPFYDRFFLGGPQDLRGFEFRNVGPKDASGEPIGGKSYGFFSLEYSFDVVKPVRAAIFYDGGFVNVNAYDFSPVDYNDNFGIGLRLFVAGAPLSLDFGIPLTHDKFNKKGNQFNFSFGTRF